MCATPRIWRICCGWAGCRRAGSLRRRCGTAGIGPAPGEAGRVAAVRDLNRLEMVGETLRAALEALAAAAPQWLAGHLDADMIKRYGARIDEWRLPKDQAGRQKRAVQTGRDGYRLLTAVAGRRAPDWLHRLPPLDGLRPGGVQQDTGSGIRAGGVWGGAGLHRGPPGRT